MLRGREPHGIEVCELSTTYIFNTEGNLQIDIYYGDEPGECENFQANATWEYTSEKGLELEIAGNPDKISLKADFPNENTLELSSGEAENKVTEFYARE